MLDRIIAFSLRNRVLVAVSALLIALFGTLTAVMIVFSLLVRRLE